MTLEELVKLLKTADTAQEIDAHRWEIAQLIPAVQIMFDFDQANRAHQYDLWQHCLHVVAGINDCIEETMGVEARLTDIYDDSMLYLAALLHDIGKPACQTPGQNGDPNMHYKGHPHISMRIVRDEVIPDLEGKGYLLSNTDKRHLLYYVEHHDDRVTLNEEHLRHHLNIPVSLEEFRKLMILEVADAKAHVQIPIVAERVKVCQTLCGNYLDMMYDQICYE